MEVWYGKPDTYLHPEISHDEYRKLVDKVGEEYLPRMAAILERIREYFQDRDWKVYPIDDLTDELYRLDLVTTRPDGVDFYHSISMLEEEVIEPGENSYGISWDYSITAGDGLVVGGFAPYNYTYLIWEADVREPGAVRERWEEFAQVFIEGGIEEIDLLCLEYEYKPWRKG